MTRTRAMVLVGVAAALGKLVFDGMTGALTTAEMVGLPLVAVVLFGLEGFHDDLVAGLKRG
jgi:hypothetical protein